MAPSPETLSGSIAKPAALALTMVLLAACSSTKMAYRYADWGIVWWVEDYVSLNDAQKQALNSDIEALRQWHCSTELPRYRHWLQALQSDIAARELDRQNIASHQEQLISFVPSLLDRATPLAVNLLSSLDDNQIQELSENMIESQQDLEEEFLRETPERTAEARAERTRERAERWLGPLNQRQIEIIAQWSEDRTNQTKIWLEGRRLWQVALLEALNRRSEPGFEKAITGLIQQSETYRGQRYQQMMTTSRLAMSDLMHKVIAAANTQQLAELEDRAQALEQDFEALTCASAPEIAGS